MSQSSSSRIEELESELQRARELIAQLQGSLATSSGVASAHSARRKSSAAASATKSSAAQGAATSDDSTSTQITIQGMALAGTAAAPLAGTTVARATRRRRKKKNDKKNDKKDEALAKTETSSAATSDAESIFTPAPLDARAEERALERLRRAVQGRNASTQSPADAYDYFYSFCVAANAESLESAACATLFLQLTASVFAGVGIDAVQTAAAALRLAEQAPQSFLPARGAALNAAGAAYIMACCAPRAGDEETLYGRLVPDSLPPRAYATRDCLLLVALASRERAQVAPSPARLANRLAGAVATLCYPNGNYWSDMLLPSCSSEELLDDALRRMAVWPVPPKTVIDAFAAHVSAANSSSSGGGGGGVEKGGSGARRAENEGARRDGRRCFACGAVGHVRASCPKGDVVVCFGCGGPGHVRRDCPNVAAATPAQASRSAEKRVAWADVV